MRDTSGLQSPVLKTTIRGVDMTLDELAVGAGAIISNVAGHGERRNRLLDMGLVPGTYVKLEKLAPMGDPIELRLRGYELTLRREDAKSIEVWEVYR